MKTWDKYDGARACFLRRDHFAEEVAVRVRRFRVVIRREAVDSERGAQNTSEETAVGPHEQRELAVLVIFDSYLG